MKVLHIIPSLSPLRGGPVFTLRAMAQALARVGVETHIATTDDHGSIRQAVPLGKPLCRDAVCYWYFPRQTRFYTVSWPMTWWLVHNIGNYDLLHIHALFSYAALPAAFFAKARGVPYIVRPLGTLSNYGMQRRHPWLKQASFRLIETRIIRYAALMHYTSEQEQGEAAELGINKNFVIIPNPVEYSVPKHSELRGQFRSQYSWLSDSTLVLFLSRLDPKKGLDLLLSAFAQARVVHPQLALVIAGSGEPDFVNRLHMYAKDLGVAAAIVWTGFLADEAKQMVLADADMFVLPSYSENFGNVIVESMSAALPVVVTDQVGIHRQVAAAGAGISIPCSVEALVEAIIRLARSSELRDRMGCAGRELVQREFSIQTITERLQTAYTAISSAENDTYYAK